MGFIGDTFGNFFAFILAAIGLICIFIAILYFFFGGLFGASSTWLGALILFLIGIFVISMARALGKRH